MKLFLPILLFLAVSPYMSFSQFGIKGGLNFAKVTKASNVNADNSTGFHAGVFLAPQSRNILGFRTELIFSRQGYDFKSGSTTGSVKLDYILLPQLMEINITKFVAIQLGAQMAFLLSAKADSSKPASTGNAQADKIIELMNRFDYGAAGGVEIHPFKGMLIGARVNISFGNLYKDPTGMTTYQNFFPEVDAKNNVVQVFAGYRF
ncbi:MAG TPA: porin family protein [Flavitalea sp.]|nr:porin family protein [Flavitalea sp.]